MTIEAPPERVVLDRDDLRRTLVRIAHEIVEKNPGSESLALVGIHTRGAVLGRRLHALVGELTGSPRSRSATSTSPSTATTCPAASRARSRSSTPRTSTSTSTGARSCSSTTSCSPGAPCGRRSTRSSTTGARSGSSSRCSPTAATASCRSAPTTSARTCRRRARSASTCGSRRSTRSTRSRSSASHRSRCDAQRRAGDMRHLLAIEDLERDDIERIIARARELRRGRAPRHQEGPDAARAHDRQPLLRGLEHPDQLLVRARRQAALGRRRLDQGRRAPRSTRASRSRTRSRPSRAYEPEAIVIRHPVRRRREAGRPAGPRPRSSTPATASTSTRARRCSTSTRCVERLGSLDGKRIWIVGDVLHSRVARSCAALPSGRWAPRSRSAARRP